MMTFFSGYGTYILAGIAALGAFLINLGLITQDNWDKMIAILIPLALVTIRRAIATTKADVVAKVEKVEMKVAVIDNAVQERVVPAVAHVATQVQDIKAVVADAAPSFVHRTDAPHVIRP